MMVSPATVTIASQGTTQLTATVSWIFNLGVTWTATQGTVSSGCS